MIKEIHKCDIALDYSNFDYDSVKAEEKIIGQEKALSLLSLALSITRPGYNIYVSGDDGEGRLSAVRKEIAKIERDTSLLRDVVYLHNESNPLSPLCVTFEKGKGEEFQKDLLSLKDNKITKEAILKKWAGDKRVEKFLKTLPPYEENKDAWLINILINHKSSYRRPLVIESHLSHQSLFGSIDKDIAPHLAIHSGSYQEASGGFLVLDAKAITSNEELWTTLCRYLDMTRRALDSSAVKGEMMNSVRPYPIPILTKVILIGTEDIYDKLCSEDETFLRLFKASPEFDYTMEASKENIGGTVSYLKKCGANYMVQESSAYSEILRYSAWLSEDRNRLSTELGALGDLLEEAMLDSAEKGDKTISGINVRHAIEKRAWRASLEEEHINREIKEGTMLISLKGEKTGVVNALAVIDRGQASFGTPCVISAQVAPGNEGIINIEHEAGLSGNIHDKGLLILEGYLRRIYAQTFPLSLYAGICFEQTYGSVDGDSASSAELYALLSAIGLFPLRQDIAVTGSVNQMGELQPVGGINEKIEGFFNACSTCGLTGTQGVIIPKQNISSLILPYKIEDAIDRGQFHIWAISSIDEGLELLSGKRRGERDRKGNYPDGTFNSLIEENLRVLCKYSQSMK